MARKAVIRSATYIENAEGLKLLGPTGKPIRKVVWGWEEIPDEAAPASTALGYDPKVVDEMLARGETQLRPKRYLLSFQYADGAERAKEVSAEDALRNHAIGESLHTAPLIACQTALIREI